MRAAINSNAATTGIEHDIQASESPRADWPELAASRSLTAPVNKGPAVRRHFAQPGVTTSALTYYRQALDASSAVGQMSQALFASRIEVPTLGITGAKDGCIAADLFARAMQPSDFAAGLTVRCIDGVGHFVHLEAAETVNRAIIEFMSQHER